MYNILVPSNDFIELIKPEAARLLGVDKKQLFVDFKQSRLNGDTSSYSKLIDLEPKNRIGFLLGVIQSSEVDDFMDYKFCYRIKDSHKDWLFFRPYSFVGSDYTENLDLYPVTPLNIFFTGFDVTYPTDGEATAFVYVTYLEFRTL